MKTNTNGFIWVLVRLSVFLVLFTVTFYAMQPQMFAIAESEQQNKKVVKVGYYLYEGYQEVDANGGYSGYGYDYFKEISQFADWKYEFVVAPFNECIRMLEAGEVDIVGGIDKNVLKSDKIAYSHLPNSTSKNQIYTAKSNKKLSFEDFTGFDKLPLGIVRGDYQEAYLDDYCTRNGVNFDRRYYDSKRALEGALEKDEVQAVYTSLVSHDEYSKVVGRMEEYPLYYGVNKNNTELLEELNMSMQNIINSNPSYAMNIQSKYFVRGDMATPSFTKEELEYIKTKGAVKVAYDKGWQPMEYYDEETGTIKGVTKDLCDLLSHYTGLKFEFVKANTLSQALDYIKTGDADMISLISHDYSISEARGIYTSGICINAALVGVIAKDRKFEGIHKVAMPEDYYLDILKNYEVTTYETVDECFEAVNTGQADATIANAYTANYYLANPKFVNLIRQDLIGYSEDLSLGVSMNEDIELLNILNKGIHCISDMELSNIILNNYVVYEQPKFQKLYYSNPVLFLGTAILSVLLIIAVLVYVIMLKNKVNSTNLKMIEFLNLEKERVTNSLRAEAERDSLTGLFNRRKIETEIKEFLLKIMVQNQISMEETKAPTNDIHCLMMLDLDRFKKINDQYGHPEGDLLLKRVATELELLAGEGNLVGRLGGDEFMFLFKNIIGRSEAEHLAEKTRNMICQIAREDEKWRNISVSIGATMFGTETYKFKELYQKSDEALYGAKHSGRNRAVFYEDM